MNFCGERHRFIPIREWLRIKARTTAGNLPKYSVDKIPPGKTQTIWDTYVPDEIKRECPNWNTTEPYLMKLYTNWEGIEAGPRAKESIKINQQMINHLKVGDCIGYANRMGRNRNQYGKISTIYKKTQDSTEQPFDPSTIAIKDARSKNSTTNGFIETQKCFGASKYTRIPQPGPWWGVNSQPTSITDF